MLEETFSFGTFIFCILMLSACNFAQESPEITAIADNTITPFATINTATMTHTVTATSIPSTQTAIATIPALAQIPTQNEEASCVVSQTNLPVYIVQRGDTLSNIASRANSTVSQLASLNCLNNTSYILVGQRLIVPNAISTSSTPISGSQPNILNPPQQSPNNDTSPMNIDDIPYPPANSQGNIILSDWNFNVDQNYIVEADDTFAFTWQMPDSMQFTQVGFVAEPYVDDFRRPRTLIGIDTDLTNGASIQWLAPSNTQTYIFAVGQVSGQSELVVSEIIQIGTEDSNQVADTLSLGFLS
ncbi:MAG: LysM peptidoglycan-binding domain-containing protein, partial [Phototrophicaceae bacterium]